MYVMIIVIIYRYCYFFTFDPSNYIYPVIYEYIIIHTKYIYIYNIMSRFYSISEYTGAYLLQYAALTGLFKSKSSSCILT